jgi:hypothetical protein
MNDHPYRIDKFSKFHQEMLTKDAEACRTRRDCRLQNSRPGIAGRVVLLFARGLIALGRVLTRRYSTRKKSYPLSHLEVN